MIFTRAGERWQLKESRAGNLFLSRFDWVRDQWVMTHAVIPSYPHYPFQES